jgi:hypothetical protein
MLPPTAVFNVNNCAFSPVLLTLHKTIGPMHSAALVQSDMDVRCCPFTSAENVINFTDFLVSASAKPPLHVLKGTVSPVKNYLKVVAFKSPWC